MNFFTNFSFYSLLLRFLNFKVENMFYYIAFMVMLSACGRPELEDQRLSITEQSSNENSPQKVEVVDRKVINFSADGMQQLGLTETSWELDMKASSSVEVEVKAEKFLKIEGSLVFKEDSDTNSYCVQVQLKDNVNYRQAGQIRLSTTGIQGDKFSEVLLPLTVDISENIQVPQNPAFLLLSSFEENAVKHLSTQLCFEVDIENKPAQKYSGNIIIEYIVSKENIEVPKTPTIPLCLADGKTIKSNQEIMIEWSKTDAETEFEIVGIGDQSDSLGFLRRVSNSSISYYSPVEIPIDRKISIIAKSKSRGFSTGVCNVYLIADSNIGMEDNGDAEGFVGNVYRLKKNTKKLPDFSKMDPISTIVTSNLDIPKRKYTKGFPGIDDLNEWFGIQFKGKIYVEAAGKHEFKLLADDGSNLYINGEKVIDNDGVHPVRMRKGKIFLDEGWHDIRVDYFQGPRYHIALQLSWRHHSEKKFKIINPDSIKRPRNFSHGFRKDL